jgi:hypothetical protein
MSKPRGDPSCGTSSEDALIPTERHPALGSAKLDRASVRNVRTLPTMPREKVQAAPTARHDASERGGLPRRSDEGPVMGLERRRWVIAADLGQLVRREEPFV